MKVLVEVRDLPTEVANKLKQIAMIEGKWLYEVYRDALVRYAENYK